MFKSLGNGVCRHPWLCVLGWAALGAVLTGYAPSAERVAAVEPVSLMPADEPYNVAVELERQAFPALASRTRTVLAFERTTGLTTADHAYLADATQRLRRAATNDSPWRVQSPASHPFLRSRLLSSDGQVALLVVHSDANYVTHRSAHEIERIEAVAREGLPEGLTLEITGEGGLGRDLSRASADAYRRTTWVTVTALLLILAVVYRAPLAAVIPLLAVGATVYVAIAALNLLAMAGWGISDTEKTFVVVLLFGSGIDFSLFWMSRYREELGRLPSSAAAFVSALTSTGPAIAASAATTIFGFLMLSTANLVPSHNAGRALVVALAIALAAAVTLVPALSWLFRKPLYWPRRLQTAAEAGQGGLWDAVGARVVRRPAGVFTGVLVLLAFPVWSGLHVDYQYDALGVVPPGSGAARGQRIAEEHFSAGELFSWSCLIESQAITADQAANVHHSRQLSDLCTSVDGVVDVWSLAAPLGSASAGDLTAALAGAVGTKQALPYYVSLDPPCLRLEIMLDSPPLSRRAMTTCDQVMTLVGDWATRTYGAGAAVHGTGLTPYILNIQSVADADQYRVMALVVGVILLIVLGWIRDLPMALCMVAATLVVYAATLGVTDLVFTRLLGASGIDWKVKLFLFVVMVAVGQDYNIFVVSRIRQERFDFPANDAVRRAILRTGAVVSSCGLIMAATLGSLAATGLPLLQQLGFAFAFGVLLDTFVVRPVLVPAFYLLSRRRAVR